MKNIIGTSYLVYNGRPFKSHILTAVIGEIILILWFGFSSVYGSLDSPNLGNLINQALITAPAFVFTGFRQSFFMEFRKSGTYLLTVKKPYKTFKTVYFVNYISFIALFVIYIVITEVIRLVLTKGSGFNFGVSLIYNLEMLLLMYGIIPFAMHLKNGVKSILWIILLLVLFSIFYTLVTPERFFPVIFILPAAIVILMPLSNRFYLKKIKACYEAE